MKKLFIIGLILAVIGIIAAALIWKFYVNKPHNDIEKATPAYFLSTDELWSKYNSERGIADSLYNNKVIEVTGNLSRTDKNDSLVSVIFVMADDPMFGDKTIACQMDKRQNDAADALKVGEKVKINSCYKKLRTFYQKTLIHDAKLWDENTTIRASLEYPV